MILKSEFPYKGVVLFIYLIVGLYFGSGGITKIENNNLLKLSITATDTAKVVYRGIPFANKYALLRTLEEEQMSSIFPWINVLPSYVSYMLTAGSFGLLGTIIRILILLSIDNKSLDECKIYTLPILGILTGLVMLGVALIFPAVILTSETNIRSGGLMFICLFSGIYVDNFYGKLSSLFTNLFKSTK